MLDLSAELSVNWYNDAVAPVYALPTFGRKNARAVLFGNTRAMWPHFIAAWRSDAGLRVTANPLDRYVERLVSEWAARRDTAARIHFAHDAPPNRVAMQRLADVSGLAPLSPSHLNVHPEYGPWIGLRAVVVLHAEGPAGQRPSTALCCNCATACAPAFDNALASTRASTETAVAANWRAWVDVRDACPVGRGYCYSEQQLRYHYTKDRALLG